ncbi:MAG: VOC family protein [Spirochaetaceae bacterium]|jgi:lactoylglutathione lyase|nr:VOC family protein [Spirochaetaceae bacterium]
MITRIGHCAIRARDIEKTAHFYTAVLGMQEAFRMFDPVDGTVASIHIYVAPSQFIEIFPHGSQECPLKKDSIGHSHICYEVDDAAAYCALVCSRGAPLDSELKRGASKCIQFWTHDPDGNSIEFMELPPDCLQVAANNRIASRQ